MTNRAPTLPRPGRCVPLCVLALLLAAAPARAAERAGRGPREAAAARQRAADAALGEDLRRARAQLQRERDRPRLVAPVAMLALGAASLASIAAFDMSGGGSAGAALVGGVLLAGGGGLLAFRHVQKQRMDAELEQLDQKLQRLEARAGMPPPRGGPRLQLAWRF